MKVPTLWLLGALAVRHLGMLARSLGMLLVLGRVFSTLCMAHSCRAVPQPLDGTLLRFRGVPPPWYVLVE